MRVGGAVAEKPTRQVAPFEPIIVVEPPRFVSRGGAKLEGALQRFGVDPTGRTVLDVGSSTGGFTDCLLAHGATKVIAVDVGTNQLHERLRADTRVVARERTDLRTVDRRELPPECDLVTVDVSFISLGGLAPKLSTLAGPSGELIVLVKPQFEATRREADRGAGVIIDPAVWRRVLTSTVGAFDRAGAGMMGAMVSPIRGASGNTEFLVHLAVGARSDALPPADVLLDAAVAEAR